MRVFAVVVAVGVKEDDHVSMKWHSRRFGNPAIVIISAFSLCRESNIQVPFRMVLKKLGETFEPNKLLHNFGGVWRSFDESCALGELVRFFDFSLAKQE